MTTKEKGELAALIREIVREEMAKGERKRLRSTPRDSPSRGSAPGVGGYCRY